jgi:hypothetical protein
MLRVPRGFNDTVLWSAFVELRTDAPQGLTVRVGTTVFGSTSIAVDARWTSHPGQGQATYELALDALAC